MVQAYILFYITPGSEDQVLKDAKLIDGVQEAYFSYGVYGLIMKVNAASMDDLKQLISYRLRTISNVKSTLTLLIN
jgi:DNA-binding Lrp family transcriptional regulator